MKKCKGIRRNAQNLGQRRLINRLLIWPERKLDKLILKYYNHNMYKLKHQQQ